LREINERCAHLAHDENDGRDYESGMTGQRTMMETVRALLVLALLFLNFAHQPAIALAPDHDVMSAVASQSFCGEPIADKGGHAPCHACRIGSGADLPPVTELPCPPMAVALRLDSEPVPVALERHPFVPAGARAPPAA
jgi:hypothetical protein